MRAAALALLLGLAGCSSCDTRAPTPEPEALDVALPRFFPLHVGDRWRHVTGNQRVASGVTGIDANGLAVIVDDARSPLTRVRATTERVEITDPEGRSLTPLLVAPLRVGTRFRFTHAPTTSCEGRITRVDTRERVAGLTLAQCVEVETRCALAAANAQSATTHVRTDTYCPDVGRVRMRSRFDPPRPDAPNDTTTELVAFRVAGGPLPPRPTRRCEEVILLPSDIAAACPGLEPDAPFARTNDSGCAFGMLGPEGAARVFVEPEPAPPRALATPDGAAYASTFSEGGLRFTLAGTHAACPEASFARVTPLLRSLVAR